MASAIRSKYWMKYNSFIYRDDLYDVSVLSLEGDFDSQVQEVLNYVRLTKEEVEGLQLLFDDLQKTLTYKWPGCVVKAFGSIVTGLGIKSSDIDCYVVLPHWLTPTPEYVIHTRSILRKRHAIFQNVFAIVGAKVPIVKFFHVPTERNCDVSFNSPNGVANSKLLGGLFQMDTRALPLAVLIKYWSKVHKLTGTNLMPNYCLTLLVIFYLQQRHILPSIFHLQEKAPQDYINNWNIGFVSGHHVTSNTESLYELLGGFFEYYNSFLFTKFVVSPFLGKPIAKELFVNLAHTPDDFFLYKYNVRNELCKSLRLDPLMCVQDPFEHNRNCAVAVHVKLATLVKTFFKHATEIFRRETENDFLSKLLVRNVSNSAGKQKRTVQVAHGVRKQRHNQKPELRQNLKKIGHKFLRQ